MSASGVGGIPSNNVSAVALNVTGVNPSTDTHLTVWPHLNVKPNASSLNVAAGKTRPNLVIVPLGPDGKVSYFNNAGAVDVVADVVGWYDGDGTNQPRYEGLAPVRLLDTRGRERHVYVPGDSVTVALTVRAKEPVDDFVFGIGLFAADGTSVYGTNTDLEDYRSKRLTGTAEATITLRDLRLTEGTYLLDVAAHRRDAWVLSELHDLEGRAAALPLAVVEPESTEEVSRAIRVCGGRALSNRDAMIPNVRVRYAITQVCAAAGYVAPGSGRADRQTPCCHVR